jgi:hypothetical protein
MQTAIENAIRRIPGSEEVTIEPGERDSTVDAFARVLIGGTKLRLVLEWKDHLDPRTLGNVVAHLRTEAEGGMLPVVVADYVPPSIRRRLERSGIGWLDTIGNVHLSGPGVVIHIEQPTPRGHVPRPKSEPFGPAAGRVAQALLEDPSGTHDLRTLAELARVKAASTVSRALSGFVDEGLVVRGEDGWTVPDAPVLMDAWLDAGMRRAAPRRVGAFSREPLSSVRDSLANRAEDVSVLVTGPTAGELLVPLMPADRLDLYVFPPARSSWFAERVMGWVPTDTAPNVHLWVATNDGPHVGEKLIQHVPVVGRAQLVLDLIRVGGRSVQVAEDLRKRWTL